MKHLNKWWYIPEIESSVLKYVIKNSWWLEKCLNHDGKWNYRGDKATCSVIYVERAAIARTGLGVDSIPRMGTWGGQDEVADTTGGSIYCSCLTSVPLLSCGMETLFPLGSPLHEAGHRTKQDFLLQWLDLGWTRGWPSQRLQQLGAMAAFWRGPNWESDPTEAAEREHGTKRER